jgi:NAD(P)-dependent dehydrogenase (short-subunit alcohol dehydrogenase family)
VRVLVTGATSGIGRAVAFQLAALGHEIVFTARDGEKARTTLGELVRETANDRISYHVVDLASQRAIRMFLDDFKSRYETLDVLINNAGILMFTRELSVDGLEMTFAVNHLAYFMLGNGLVDIMPKGGRIINVSSVAEQQGRIDFANLQGETGYTGMTSYANSKLANLLFTYEFARRLGPDPRVTVNALHPGGVRTAIGDNNRGVASVVWRTIKAFFRGVERGAETPVYLAVSPDVANVTGGYFVDRMMRRSSARSHDAALAARFWEASEALVRVPA